MTTWKEIKVIALQKMFLISGNELETNDSTRSYLAAMPAAYNEAVRLLSTVNKHIVKNLELPVEGAQGQIRFNLAEIPDLYKLMPNDLYFVTASSREHAQVQIEAGQVLILDGSKAGTYVLYYYAYPLTVTAQTENDEDLQLAPEVASIIPLYIASQLYKDDEPGQATMYRNEFEAAREQLMDNPNNSGQGSFRSIKGWW